MVRANAYSTLILSYEVEYRPNQRRTYLLVTKIILKNSFFANKLEEHHSLPSMYNF